MGESRPTQTKALGQRMIRGFHLSGSSTAKFSAQSNCTELGLKGEARRNPPTSQSPALHSNFSGRWNPARNVAKRPILSLSRAGSTHRKAGPKLTYREILNSLPVVDISLLLLGDSNGCASIRRLSRERVLLPRRRAIGSWSDPNDHVTVVFDVDQGTELQRRLL